MFQIFWLDVLSCIYYTVYDFKNQNERKALDITDSICVPGIISLGLWVYYKSWLSV